MRPLVLEHRTVITASFIAEYWRKSSVDQLSPELPLGVFGADRAQTEDWSMAWRDSRKSVA